MKFSIIIKFYVEFQRIFYYILVALQEQFASLNAKIKYAIYIKMKFDNQD